MARTGEVLSHWHQTYADFKTSSLDFYAAVEKALERRALPDVDTTRVKFAEAGAHSPRREYLRVSRGKFRFDVCAAPYGANFFFSSWLSRAPSSRLVLLVLLVALWAGVLLVTGPYAENDIFGGFKLTLLAYAVVLFLGGMAVRRGLLYQLEDAILDTPVVGWLYEVVFQPHSFYELDTAQAFGDTVHGAVLEVLDGFAQTKGLRALTEDERKPAVRNLLGK